MNTASQGTGIHLAVDIPKKGCFTLTVDIDKIPWAVYGGRATAAMAPVAVSDTRNTYPGWSVSGSGGKLDWTPTSAGRLPRGVALGSRVAPVSPGLDSAWTVLAFVDPGNGNGFGTSALGANLASTSPLAQQAGGYTGTLTITVVTASP